MRTLLLAFVLAGIACGGSTPATNTPPRPLPDGGVADSGVVLPDGGVSFDAGVTTDGGVSQTLVRPIYFSTSDHPLPASALTQVDSLWSGINARLAEEVSLSLVLGPAQSHVSSRSCAQLGADAQAMLVSIANEMAPDGNTKFQVIVPCDDPTGVAAGIAYIGGAVAVTFDGPGRLGNPSDQAVLSSVAIHELGHNLGLVHNSVGANCMGPVELRSIAALLIGDSSVAPCVLLPHQKAIISQQAAGFVNAVGPSSFAGTAPSVVASKTSSGVQLVWLGSAPSGASGWHIERDGVRVLQSAKSSNQVTDSDGANEYHSDPAMSDPGLVSGQTYCYRLRAFDPNGVEGPVGAQSCITY
ncbi:MAG: zinc-dependent metalloprotease family protein [Myxococcaceae bacterium]